MRTSFKPARARRRCQKAFTGKLMLNLMGSFAEFEREIMLERQREGVARAKAEGKYKGRVPTAQRKTAEVIQLRGKGGEARRDRGEARDQSSVGVPCVENPTEGGQLTSIGAVPGEVVPRPTEVRIEVAP